MIELVNKEQLENAINRAKAEAKNLFVQRTNAIRQYRVTNKRKGITYLVNFFVQNGRKFAVCECKAGQKNLACKHVVAAAAMNMYLAENGMLTRKAVSLV